MDVKIAYPEVRQRKEFARCLASVLKWTFLFAGFICIALNLVTGGKAWSVIVAWSLWLLWTQVVSPDLVEYNFISQLIKLVVNGCILLVFIDMLITPGWAVEVVPIIFFSALLTVGVLFFADFERQRQNMFPMLLLNGVCLIGSIIGLIVWHEETRWVFVVVGVFALSLLVGCFAKLRLDFIKECRKLFSTK